MRDFSKKRHSGFKAYDIRGIVPTEVNEELAYRVARAYAQLYHPKKISVGYDIRPSSLSIADAVIQGMNDAGVDVYNIGLCGTEMMYFTTFYYGLDGGFMITASHNPANNNGIKIVREKGIPVSADTGTVYRSAHPFFLSYYRSGGTVNHYSGKNFRLNLQETTWLP